MSDARKYLVGCLIGCGGIAGIGALCLFGLLIWLGMGPEGSVRTANNMEPYALEYIKAHNLVPADERLIAYYDVTLNLDSTECAILTDQSLIYHKNGQNTIMKLADIASINQKDNGMLGIDITAMDNEGNVMVVSIAALNNSSTFYDALMARYDAVKPREESVPQAEFVPPAGNV